MLINKKISIQSVWLFGKKSIIKSLVGTNTPDITCIAQDGSILNSGDGYILVDVNKQK